MFILLIYQLDAFFFLRLMRQWSIGHRESLTMRFEPRCVCRYQVARPFHKSSTDQSLRFFFHENKSNFSTNRIGLVYRYIDDCVIDRLRKLTETKFNSSSANTNDNISRSAFAIRNSLCCNSRLGQIDNL